MDISLPTMDGWEVTKLLKANPGTRHIPVIAVTAHVLVGDRARTAEVGCSDYDISRSILKDFAEKSRSLLSEKNLA